MDARTNLIEAAQTMYTLALGPADAAQRDISLTSLFWALTRAHNIDQTTLGDIDVSFTGGRNREVATRNWRRVILLPAPQISPSNSSYPSIMATDKSWLILRWFRQPVGKIVRGLRVCLGR